MTDRVVPEPSGVKPDPLTLGEKKTTAYYLAKALAEELKHASKVDNFPSASAYVEALLIFALRRREAERIADRKK